MANFPALPTLRTRDAAFYDSANGQTFKDGALLVSTAGVMSECGANPASIFGFSMGPAGKDVNAAGLKIIVGRVQENNKYWMQFTSDGTTPTAPAASDVGATYGVTKGTDGIWTVDKSKNAANQRVVIHTIDTTRNLVEVSVLAANRQLAP